jgi:hypothetical protein
MTRAYSDGITGMQIVPVARQVRDVARSAGKGLRSVQLTSDSVEIRVGECSAVLPVSAFHALLEVLELGEIPFHKVSSRRRIRASDLAMYLETREGRKREVRVDLDQLLTELRSRLC